MPKTGTDRSRANRYTPNVQKYHCESQTRQTPSMTQHRALQIKSMSFHIAKHFFRPHPATVCLQHHPPIGQIGRQTPRFVFANLPIDQQVNR
jgi:hypothetical protein